MSLFSNIFGNKNKKIFFNENYGNFRLVYSKDSINLWTNDQNGMNITLHGTVNSPYLEQISFIENIPEKIKNLNEKISEKFIAEFHEAGLEVSFKNWQNRFNIIGIQITSVSPNTEWSITFEDIKELILFTLHIENQELIDFSIDT